jgi:hypothetical protein
MRERRVPASDHILPQIVLFLSGWLVACSPVHGQVKESPSTSPAQSHASAKTTLKGCLSSGPNGFQLATASAEGWFVLTGKTAGLEKYVDRELTLEGTRGDDIPIEGFFKPFPSFVVSKIVELSDRLIPKLDPSFANTASWQTERNSQYGVKIPHPLTMNVVESAETTAGSNFATQDGAEIVANLGIPGTSFSSGNLLGGSFTIYVNRQVKNRESCMQFGQLWSQDEPLKSYTVGNLIYAEAERGSAAMGTWYSDYHFHTFQNGLCYELAFELVEFNAHNADTGCNTPLLSPEDNFSLIKPLIGTVSFFSPAMKSKQASDSHAVPQVTEFTASSQTADDVANRGQITFSWQTEGADYVEFTYTCLDPANAEEGGVSYVVISEDGPNRYCLNTASFKTRSTGPINHSPNSSANIGFGYFNHDDATSVVVTITPYSHGEAYPTSSKSLTVIVNPYNPFPMGIPTETRNMRLAYPPGADGSANYPQGSALTITWTDERAQDPCVNLYLVQDNPADGEKYLLQINSKREIGCLKPASHGSYTWTVTSKFLGSGFRVLARTPGGTSGTLGAPFDIVKHTPNSVQ